MSADIEVVVYSSSDDGHRREYLEFVARITRAERRTAGALIWARVPVLFLMVEDSFALYAAVSIVRAILGRRTVGLLFRPRPAVEARTYRLRLKRAVLRVLRSVHNCQTLSIIPFSLDQRLAQIADGWIYDFQLWDLRDEQRRYVGAVRAGELTTELSRSVAAVASGRKVICAIGRQDRDKGFDVFAHTFATNPEIRGRFLFAFGGQVAPDMSAELSALEAAHGVSVNRRVSEDELLSLYGAADFIWACYAPEYDQASGILGRAVQLGVPAIVRRGSLIHDFCVRECIAHVPYHGKINEMISARVEMDASAGVASTVRFATHSLVALREALNLPTGRRV